MVKIPSAFLRTDAAYNQKNGVRQCNHVTSLTRERWGRCSKKRKKEMRRGRDTMASCTYRIVISAEQLVLVDAEDHITDSKSGLSLI